jgi:uncharacterized membrane protein
MTLPRTPIPKRPFRDSALFYAALAIVFVVVVAISGGNLMLAIPVAVGLFVIATGYAWWKFRQRMRLEESEEAQ